MLSMLPALLPEWIVLRLEEEQTIRGYAVSASRGPFSDSHYNEVLGWAVLTREAKADILAVRLVCLNLRDGVSISWHVSRFVMWPYPAHSAVRPVSFLPLWPWRADLWSSGIGKISTFQLPIFIQ